MGVGQGKLQNVSMMSQAVESFSLRYSCNWVCILTCAQLHGTSLKAACVSTAMQCNTVQYNTMNYNTIQYNELQYNTIQYNTMNCNAIQPLCPSHNCSKEDMVAGVQKS